MDITTVRAVLNETGIKDFSFCSFEAVSERLLDCRAKSRLPQNAKTVIMAAFPYKAEYYPPLNISRYAAVPDYHTVCGELLKKAADMLKSADKEGSYEPFTDNSPIPEVFAAATAGLGIKGDNGLLITRKYGSYVFLGEIVTDRELPVRSEYMECTHCGECRKACPVNYDKATCLSAVSQKKGELTKEESRILKQNKIIWGCDICAEACPFNRYAQLTYFEQFKNGYRNSYSPDEDSAGRPYLWRGEETVKRNYFL